MLNEKSQNADADEIGLHDRDKSVRSSLQSFSPKNFRTSHPLFIFMRFARSKTSKLDNLKSWQKQKRINDERGENIKSQVTENICRSCSQSGDFSFIFISFHQYHARAKKRNLICFFLPLPRRFYGAFLKILIDFNFSFSSLRQYKANLILIDLCSLERLHNE